MSDTHVSPPALPSLFDDLERIPADDRPEESLTLDERFWRFHRANPDVFAQLRQMSLDLVRVGRRKGSIKMLFEVLRWQRALVTHDPNAEPFRLNNVYTSRYARLLMAREPSLEGFFDLRELKTE